jgi:hypothetical protein
MTHPDVQRLHDLARQIKNYGHQAPQIIVDLHKSTRALQDDWVLDAESRRRGAQVFKEAASEKALDLQVKYDRARREFNEILAKTTASHRAAGGGTEGELRRQAAWSRMERTLNALPQSSVKYVTANDLLMKAAQTGDQDTLDAARVELPSWLEHQGETMPDSLGDWLDIQSSIPGVGDARAAAMQHERPMDRAAMAVGHTSHGLANGKPPQILVGMNEGEVVHVSEEAVCGPPERR